MKEYIMESSKKLLKEWKEILIFNRIPILIIHPFSKQLDLLKIKTGIESFLKTSRYLNSLEGIYVGKFEELENKKFQCVYTNGAIYVLNLVSDFMDENKIAKDIVHEIGHLLEDKFSLELYGDSELENEFSMKRKKLYKQSPVFQELDYNNFINNNEYNEKIDDFLYQTIGYENLKINIAGIFISPYSVTSLGEYFSNGFEFFHTSPEQRKNLKLICPVLYNKLLELHKLVLNS